MAPPPKESGHEFQPSDRELVSYHLAPRAGLCGPFNPGYIEEGVDVFSVRPRALPFWPVHCGRQDGAAWGFFFAARPAAGKACPGPGGCWVRHGPEKKYNCRGEAIAFRRRFTYRFTWKGGAVWAPTRWLMKEFRLNTDSAIFRAAHPEVPDPEAAGVVFVLHKVFRRPVLPPLPSLPPPPPQPSPPVGSSESGDEGSECAIVDEELHELVLHLRALTEGKCGGRAVEERL